MSTQTRSKPLTRRLGVLLVTTLLVVSIPALTAGAWDHMGTSRVSVTSGSAEATGGDSQEPSVSANGRYVAFASDATNLVPGDTNGWSDVFVHDRATGETTRVSVTSGGAQATGGDSQEASISGDGRYVAFFSHAADLVPGDTNALSDIFVHDRTTGETTRVSVASGGAQAVGGEAREPVISADGRHVAFRSGATNLVPGDTNGLLDIFAHDRVTGETVRVNVTSAGAQAATADSRSPAINADGRFVAFVSTAEDLVPGDNNGYRDIFVHDRLTAETTRVSVKTGGAQATGGSSRDPSISGDGRYVAFHSPKTDLVPGDTNGVRDIFLHDRDTVTTSRVNMTSGGAEAMGGDSFNPSLSADGRLIAFESDASNIVPGDSNGVRDVFLRELSNGDMARVSVASGGAQATGGHSYEPAVSTGGRYVAFDSAATNLANGDGNGAKDVFVSATGAASDELAGPTRYETAIAASQEAYPTGLPTDSEGNRTVVVATGENWPDALGGSALAGVHDGPILLTLTSTLPAPVMTEIQRLDATDAIILGGTGAVSSAVENALAAELGATSVRRLGGPTRYETAELIARAVANATESRFEGTAFVATGLNFPDALAGSPLAAAGHWPIFLAPETGMTPSTLATMNDIAVTDVVILGGTGVVSQGIENALAGAMAGDVTRLAGPTRYETAVEVATYATDEAGLSFAYTALATGENFPDALAGGVLQGRDRGVMLLTHTGFLTQSTADVLAEEADSIAHLRYLGGPGAVSAAVRADVGAILQ